jgi:hypothetical protein
MLGCHSIVMSLRLKGVVKCLVAMSVIGRSEQHYVIFDQLDEDGKVRTAQMVAIRGDKPVIVV